MGRFVSYELKLPLVPVFDVNADFSPTCSIPDGLEAQAAAFELAAKRCRVLLGAAVECPEIKLSADNYYIWVEGPQDRLDMLVTAGVLDKYADEWDDAEDEADGIRRDLGLDEAADDDPPVAYVPRRLDASSPTNRYQDCQSRCFSENN